MRYDSDFVGALRAGVKSAWEQFITDMTPLLRGYLRLAFKGDSALIDDVMQETWTQIYDARMKFMDPCAYMFGIARNLIKKSWALKAGTLISLDLDEMNDIISDEAVEDEYARRDEVEYLSRLVHCSMDMLSVEDNEIVSSMLLKDVSVTQLATLRGLSENTLHVKLYRAKTRLAEAVLVQLLVDQKWGGFCTELASIIEATTNERMLLRKRAVRHLGTCCLCKDRIATMKREFLP
jgi:RNA polymerase sigma factor (sigma-70 family)